MNGAAATSYRLLIAEVYELAGRSRSTSEAIARRHGQTAARWHVLSVLSDHPATASAVARRLGLTRQSVQRVVGELLATRCLLTRPNPDHQRAPLLELTEAGRGHLRALTADADLDRGRQLAAAGLTGAQLEQARQTLRALIDAMHD